MSILSLHADPLLLMDVPYTVTDDAHRRVVALAREALDHPFLSSDSGIACLEGIGDRELAIDCSAISQANSLLIAWLIRVAQGAKPRHVSLVGVSERQVVLFRRMRLDHILDIPAR